MRPIGSTRPNVCRVGSGSSQRKKCCRSHLRMRSGFQDSGRNVARTPVVGGNWKMNLGRTPARELLQALRTSLDGLRGVNVAVCPPAAWIGDAADILRGSSVGVGAQNVYWEAQGAFTGEVSAAML